MSNKIKSNQVDTGTDTGQLVVLEDVDGNPGLPAVDGSQLTNLPSSGGFDSTLVTFLDDFNGYSLDTSLWDTNLGTDGNCSVTAIGGLCTLQTGADAAETMATNGAQVLTSRYFDTSSGNSFIEAEIALPSGATEYAFYFGLTVGNSLQMPFTMAAGDAVTSNAISGCGFVMDTNSDSDTIWLVGVKNNVDATHQNSAATFTSFVLKKFRIEITSGHAATFYIDGVQVGTQMANALNSNTAYYVTVAFFNRDSGAGPVLLDVDYILTSHTRRASI